MKIYLAFILLLPIVFSSYAQEKSDSLSYPDLIPLLDNGLYGYCDKDKNTIIEPQFEGATFFGEDLDFHDIKDPKKKIFGSSAYATVWQDGQQMRIDKKGNVVYRYNPEDFNEIRPKESINESIKQSYEKFQDDQTLLWGVRDMTTGEVLIPARYNIHEELYSYFHIPQYPLMLVSSPLGGSKFYVGLNGTEYRESVAAQSKTEGYKIDYRVHLSGSDFKKNNAQNKAIRIDCHVHRSHKEDFVEALAAVCPDENIDVFYYFQSASGDDINLMLFFTNGRQYTHRIRNVPLNLFGEKISLLAEKYRVSFGFADGYNLDTGDEPNIRLMVDQDYIITQRPKPPLFKSLLKWINSI